MKESCFGLVQRLCALLVAFFAFTLVAGADGVSITGVQDSFNRKVTLTIGARSENMVLLVAYGAEDKGDDFTTDEDQGGWHYAQPEKFFAAGDETVYDYPMPYDFDETTKYLKFFLLPASQTFMESLSNITSSDPANQYIDTEYTLNAKSDLRVDVNITSLTKEQKVFEIIPDGTSDPYIVFNMYFNNSKHPAYNLRDSTATSGTGYNTELTTVSADKYVRWQLSLKDKQARLDDTKVKISPTLTATPSGQARFYGVGTISKIVIGDEGGTRRWMECAMGFNDQGDLEPGLYCSITHKFYPSAGSKPFGKGTTAGNFRKDLLKGVPILGRSETFEYVPHEHTWGEWETLIQPTYTEEGLQQHTCTVCEESETAPIPVLENDLVLSVSGIAIGADGVATVSYNLEAIGEKEVSIVAEYQKAGDTVWTKVELAKAKEIGAGQGTITGLTDGISYNFKVYADGGDHTSVPVVKNDVAVPFSWTHWTGAAETDNNWTTAANWENETVAHPAQGLEFQDATTSEIVLDRDAALSCLYLGSTARLSLSGGHKLTVTETADQGKNLLYRAAELTISGEGTELYVQPVNRMGQSSNVKLLVKDGARLTNTRWRFGDNDNYTFVATNGACLAMTSVQKSFADNSTQFYFAAFEGSDFTIGMNSDCSANFGYGTFVANASTLSLAPFNVGDGNPTVLSDNGGTLVLGKLTPDVDGASVSVRNGSSFEVRGNFYLANGGKTATLEVSGAGSKISTTAGATVFGNGTADKLTVRLAPGADWTGTTPRISIKNNATLKSGVKFVVDLAGMTPEMMGKRMPILSCTGTASYAVPGKADIVRVNNQNYVVTFSQDGKVLYMTVDYGPGLMLLIK